jgi:hypothetical protein
MRLLSPAVALVALTGAVTPFIAEAQSAKDVLNGMVAEYEKRMANVANYTVVQDAMGTPMTMYFEKETVDGRAVFRLRHSSVAGMTSSREGEDREDFDMYAELPKLAERATYKGRETVDGQAVHVIVIDDLQGIKFGRGMSPRNADFEPRRATLYVDTRQSVPRRMILEGQMRNEGKTADVTTTVDMLDYREVEGMLHPFRSQVRIDGLGQAADPEQRKQYEEMKKQLAEMPESQRQMVEQMMKGRLEQMEKMMAGDGGMNVELLVRELRVNKGAPNR